MKIKDFMIEYDLHDSLLENVKLIEDKLILEVELCNWLIRRERLTKETISIKTKKPLVSS